MKTSCQTLLILAGFLLVVSIVACSKHDPLTLLMSDLEKGVEARDVDVFEKRLASDFTGNDRISRSEALTTLRRYFTAYENVKVDFSDVERSESGKRVTFQASFSGKANEEFNLQNLLPSTATYSFELRLVQEDSMLKVRKAYWQQVSGF